MLTLGPIVVAVPVVTAVLSALAVALLLAPRPAYLAAVGGTGALVAGAGLALGRGGLGGPWGSPFDTPSSAVVVMVYVGAVILAWLDWPIPRPWSEPGVTSPVRCRIAPSPTGPLHIGTARTALYNYLFAKRHGGTFVLRLEDTDVARSTVAYEQDILDGLHWLGLDWDEGPEVGGLPARGPYGPYRQMERLPLYAAAAERLLAEDKAYYCYCSPEELAADRAAQEAAHQAPRYVGRCAHLTAAERRDREAQGRKPVIRFRVGEGVVAFDDLVRGHVEIDTDALGGDLVIVRSDGTPLYHFTVVVDDADDGDDPHHPGRGPPLQHAQAHPAVPGPRGDRAAVRPPAAHPQRRPQQDEQAQEPDRDGRLHRPGLRARGAGQLPGAARLGQRRHRGALLARRADAAASTWIACTRAARSSIASGSSGSTASGSGGCRRDELVERVAPFLEADLAIQRAAGRVVREPTEADLRALVPLDPGAPADPRRRRRPGRLPLRRGPRGRARAPGAQALGRRDDADRL